MGNEGKKDCYLGINGKKYGPVSEQEIKKLYAQKKINGDTNFARVGATEWITVAKSGIIAATEAADDDGLPPLPPGNKNASANSPEKKSKLGLIAAGLGVAVVISIVGLIFVILHIGNGLDVTPTSNAAQDNSTGVTTSTPEPTPTPTAEPMLAKEDIIGQWEWVGMDMVFFIGENGLLFGLSGSDLTKGRYTIFRDSVICYWDDLPDQPIPLIYSASDGCFYTESDNVKHQFVKKTTYNSIEGAWEGAYDTASATFQFAGKGSVSITIKGKSAEGTYEVTGNRVILKFEELDIFTILYYYPEIDLLHSTLGDGAHRFFQHISGDVATTASQSEAGDQGSTVTESSAQSSTPQIAYNGISIDRLLGTVDGVINVLGGSPLRDEYSLKYDDMEFRHDKGEITSFELYDPESLAIGGVTLGKNQTELMDLLGEPDADGETYGGYAMSYYLGDYSIFIELGEADADAWRVTVSRYDATAAAEMDQSYGVEENAQESETTSYVDEQKRLMVESYLPMIKSADEYYEQGKAMGDSYNMYYPVAMGLYETAMDTFKLQYYNSAGELTDCTDTPEYAHCASRWRECKRIIGY